MANISMVFDKSCFLNGQRAVPRDGEKCKKSARDQDRPVPSDAPKLLDFARLYLYYEYLRFISLDSSLRVVAVIKDILCFQREERFCNLTTTCSEG